jgi:hypothetical protein
VWVPVRCPAPPASRLPDPTPIAPTTAVAADRQEKKGPTFKTELQNGAQLDQTGQVYPVHVLQGTFHFPQLFNELAPGESELSFGVQVNLPKQGKSILGFGQFSRTDWAELHLLDDRLTLAFEPFVQLALQAPLDAGSRAQPNLSQVGLSGGATASLELKLSEGVSVKLALQGSVGGGVDTTGHVSPQAGVFAYGSLAIDWDRLLSGEPAKQTEEKKTEP